MKTTIHVIFYSMYGHIYRMSEALAQGIKEVPDCEVVLYQVPELVPEEILVKSGAKKARDTFSHIPFITVDQLPNADAIIFGTPTRFGNMCAQMRNFLDQLGGLWSKNAFVGKVGSVFTSSATQHGGQETTLTSFHITLLHLGMLITGVPYSEKGLSVTDQLSGGTPYGASTIAGADGLRMPSENELAIARFQGKYVAQLASDLKRGRERG